MQNYSRLKTVECISNQYVSVFLYHLIACCTGESSATGLKSGGMPMTILGSKAEKYWGKSAGSTGVMVEPRRSITDKQYES